MDDLLNALTTTVAKRGQVGLDYAWKNPGTGKVAKQTVRSAQSRASAGRRRLLDPMATRALGRPAPAAV
jgi:hypothetical protein